jgi:type I restriction enzyme S subunit
VSHQARLKDLGRWFSGGTPPRDDESAWAGDIPWLSAKDIDRDVLRLPTAFITEAAAARSSRIVPTGSILMIVRGMALAHGLPVVLTGQRAAFNQDLRALVPDPSHDPRFIRFALRGNRLRLGAHIDKAAHGTARVVDSIYRERVWTPDRTVQRAVADFLDRECERLGALNARLIRFRAGVGDELAAHVDETLRDLGVERRPLAWAVDPARPIMYGIVLPGEPVTDGVLLVKGGNVERDQLLPENLVRVAPAIEAKYARARLRGGDLLVTIRGSWGATAQLPPESDGANITQDTARVSPASHVHTRFLLHALRAPSSQSWLGSMVRGTGVKGINIFDLRRLMVPIPTLARQRELATAFDAWATHNLRLAAVVDQTQARLAEYRDALIAEAVTGQLDVTGVSDAQMDERAHAVADGAVAMTLTAASVG